MNISELKSLLISAKNELNSMLSLNRTKKIMYEEKQYFELVTFLSIWNAAGENASQLMNTFDSVPNGDSLMQQLQKLDCAIIESQFDAIFDKQCRKQFKNKPHAIAIIDLHEQETYTKEKKTSS